MKKIISILLLLLAHYLFAQKEMTTKTGIVNFEASVPLYEEVVATNKNASCVLNLKSGVLSSEVKMKGFEFKLSLMREHFNTKYLETDDYPTAHFKGTIVGFNWNNIDVNPKEYKLKGEMKIHGKTKKINTIVTLRKLENKLEIISDFSLNVKDFDIEIPKILSLKVADKVNVNTHFLLQ
ncbi:YceI family protein [Flavobacterium sp.]|uniref:YceI family protein n=1 Tax=Flavobacterium sp. TaxID=239 RepID=UPI00286E8E04|nr:YceI family protein [Flavobacterium sp.]